MSWQQERARRRRAREMERRLRELDDLDRRYGLGAPVAAAPRPARRSGGCSGLLSLLLVLAMLAISAYLFAPQLLPDARSLVDRLTGETDLTDRAFSDGVDGEPGSGGEGYTFAVTQPDGVSPVTWPCEGTIPVEVNPQGAPEGYADLVASAVARVNDASGFTLEVVGETDDRTFLDRGAGPVLLGFADAEEVPALGGSTAGLGGAVHAQRSIGGPRVAVGGMVVLDVDVFGDQVPAPVAETIVIHELAHVLGLGHTDTGGELMQPVSLGQTQLGTGDLAGLRHLREAACSSV
ncbi:matrixin family metalloprotease [Ornithinimicrobium sufpigmenti]|uniref:matrixin family metalloprotease n=1 Tax=Ornithinimicrobium sufpigmenti TaxID=2508882 RepID=UPI0010359687|nr:MULTISPECIES: matrixin family metalloprotease [unclassified Ornithinimicrobium]